MKTIAFFNPEGGVGTTSLVCHLAWMYADHGVNVLAADLDPQANLTRMFSDDEKLDLFQSEVGARRTVYDALQPLLEGVDDTATPPCVAAPAPGLGLAVGDLRLATTEDELSAQWSACLDRKPEAFRVLSALACILRRSAAEVGARLILVDVGPNLGAFNRTVLVAADMVVVALTPDFPSLRGLRILGSTLRRWRSEWKKRHERNPIPDLAVPEGAMRPIGYVVMQRVIRLYRPVKHGRWMSRIPVAYGEAFLDETPTSGDTDVGSDPHCLATLRPYGLLAPLAREAGKPIFALKSADGAIGGQGRAVQNCYREYRTLAGAVAERAGFSFPGWDPSAHAG